MEGYVLSAIEPIRERRYRKRQKIRERELVIIAFKEGESQGQLVLLCGK